MKRHWYVLLEETDFDTLSVSGPFPLTEALGIARVLNVDHPHAAHVVNGDSGHRIPQPFATPDHEQELD